MGDYQEVEQAVLEFLRGQCSETVFNLWFGELRIEKIDDQTVTMSAPTSFKQSILVKHHLDTLREAVLTGLGIPADVYITVRETDMAEERAKTAALPDPEEVEEEERERREKEEMTRNIEGSDTVAGYTFDNFIVGDSNRFAHAACIAVAQSFTTDEEILTNPLEEKFNPLFIYGQSGLGKTHLLYAITNEIKKRTPGVKFLYIRGEDFVNELIDSIQKGSTSAFRQRYRNTDVLLIDDIHFIAGKESIQEEFFNTFNALYEKQKQIILTSDRPPCEIKNLADRLRTRFEWGLTADIQPPSPELRAAIIRLKAEKQGIVIADEIVAYMAEKIKSNIRTIEGAIRKLYAMNKLTGVPITIDTVKKALADVQSGGGESTFTVDRIFSLVEKRFDVPIDTIKGNRRQANVVYARHMCMYLIRTLTDFPLSNIGTFFGCNHSNVILACNKVESMMKEKPEVRRDVEELTRQLKS